MSSPPKLVILMARNRNSPPIDFVDKSLTVATHSGKRLTRAKLITWRNWSFNRFVVTNFHFFGLDVLFKPLEAGGERFLQLRTLKLEHWKRALNTDKKYVINTDEDIQYLRGLEPTDWKVCVGLGTKNKGGMGIIMVFDAVVSIYRIKITMLFWD